MIRPDPREFGRAPYRPTLAERRRQTVNRGAAIALALVGVFLIGICVALLSPNASDKAANLGIVAGLFGFMALFVSVFAATEG